MKARTLVVWMLACGAVLSGTGAGEETTMKKKPPASKPPMAKKIPVTTEIHGYTITDDYAWLRDERLPRDPKANPEITAYLKAEDAYASARMKHTAKFQKALYAEMLARIKETDEEVPYRDGSCFYYTRTVKGKQYPIHCRKRGSLDAKEEITLDVNKMAKGHAFFSVGGYEIADDENLLAFKTDARGFRQYTLYVKDLAAGKTGKPIAERVTGVAWAADNATLFYVQEDPVTKRSHKLFRHRLGSAKHELLYEEKDELYDLRLYRTRSGAFIMAVSKSSTTSETRYLDAARPEGDFRLLAPRRDGHEYYASHAGDSFYIRTNDKGKNFRLVTASASKPAPENWKEVIPHRADVMLEGVHCFKNHFIAQERDRGLQRLVVHDIKTGAARAVEFSEASYSVSPLENEVFDTALFRFGYESFTTPASVYDYDVKTRERTLLKQEPVLGGYDPSLYETERVHATAADGTLVPVSLVYKKPLARDGKRPMLLEAYGSYGIPYDADFSSMRLSLLDRGVVYALAHIRGGGDLGKDWHDQGKMTAKRNTFTDFIACAEHLVAQKYTAPDRLVITGGSAGGLLMGAVVNMRPEIFKAVVSYVPFVDVMNTMLDDTLPLTVGEYLEWGNPNEKAAYDVMRSYSPYDNIERKSYPAMLIRTSLNDSQVMYWEPAKYVAKLRAMKTDSNPLLFKIKLKPGGHGGASGRYDRLEDEAFDMAFILEQMGIQE